MLLLVDCAVKSLLEVVVNPENHATPPPVRNRTDFTPAVLDVNHLNENVEIPLSPKLPPGMTNDSRFISEVDWVILPAVRFGSAVGEETRTDLPEV